MSSCRCCKATLANGSLFCRRCWNQIIKHSRTILSEKGEALHTEDIVYEISKWMNLADLTITYSILKGKNRNLKRNIKILLQRGPRSTSSIKNYFNGSIGEGPKKGRPRMKHGVISQTLVNVLAKDPDIKEIGKDKTGNINWGSYEERVWALTQHLEIVPALHTRLSKRKGFEKKQDNRWMLPEWES